MDVTLMDAALALASGDTEGVEQVGETVVFWYGGQAFCAIVEYDESG
jgi:hypothetical protein